MERQVQLSDLPECLLQDLVDLASHLERHLPHAEHAQLSIDNLKKDCVNVLLTVRGWGEGQN